MTDLTLTTALRKILRETPGIRRYYRMIAQLEAERSQAVGRLSALSAECSALAALLRTVEVERDEANARQQAAISLAYALEVERDTAKARNEQLAAELVSAQTLSLVMKSERAEAIEAHARAQSRAAAIERERDIAVHSSTRQFAEFADGILVRLAENSAFQAEIGARINASILGLATRQEEATAAVRRILASGGRGLGEELYLDLLEAALCGALTQDASASPWRKDGYDPAIRAIGRDWPDTAQTMIGTARMRNLRMLLQLALDEQIPGDFIETGVWRGGACIYAKGILAVRREFARRVFVADSFCGLPPPDSEKYPADAGDLHSTYEGLAISRAEVAENFRRYGLLDDSVVFLEGWFKDTLPDAPIDRLALLRLDGDMYESTMDALSSLYDKVSPGGFVIVDDYILPACAAAVDDFRADRTISAPMNEVDGAAVWWRKPA